MRPVAVRLLFAVAVLVVVVDLGSKAAAVAYLDPERPVRLLGGALWLVLVRNAGAAFSLAAGYTWILTLVAVVAVVVIVRMSKALGSLWWGAGLGLVLGGAFGNLVDRVFREPGPFRGHVVDFLSLFSDHGEGWAVFNIADSAIVCGAALMVVLSFLGVEHSSGRER
ncbi:lipoprotein signal peptidase [Segniliparus rotundus DSM 44985]|uniref:Lipoprotein signal peptidase n=1 Tax=Segniliparus rotundus (strain ATCC BAA-972 / CDC 1076 / CIP 108378 / DSM 44985 / JCM 13578) TaxID=640132 RepID=D6Z7G3_SEGRD|nr:lipoprotein signal peptidase [Segniliparus rotundus DSM 44985]